MQGFGLKQMRKQYDRLLLSDEQPKEGVAVYVCNKCGMRLYTRQTVAGKTPEIIGHKCGGRLRREKTITEEEAKQQRVKVFDFVRPSWRWVRRALTNDTRLVDYALAGGLILKD